MQPSKSRRAAEAVRMPLSSLVTVLEPGGAAVRRLRALDLGAGGVFLRTDDPLPEATVVDLRFTLDGGQTVEGPARVVRRVPGRQEGEPAGMALTFEGLAPEPAASIEAYISRQQFCPGPPPEATPQSPEAEADPVCTEEYIRFCCSRNAR